MYPLNIGFLLLLLSAAAWHDIRSRRIPNALVFSGAVAGVLSNALLPQEMGGLGAVGSLTGLGAGFLLLLPFYLLRAMGGGDVKLMAMTGAFLGVRAVMGAFLYILLAGGLLALALAWRQGRLRYKLNMALGAIIRPATTRPMIGNLPESTAKFDKLPYGVAIAAGTAAYLAQVSCG